MPYKGVESFKIDEEVVRRWAWDLKPSTAKTYVFYFLKFLEWCKEKGYWSSAEEMLENAKKADTETLYKHLDIILEYIKSCKTGFNDRRIRHQAIRNFYEYYRAPLPRPSRHELSRIFSPSETDKIRAVSLPPLTIEEVRQIIIHSPQPHIKQLTWYVSKLRLERQNSINSIDMHGNR